MTPPVKSFVTLGALIAKYRQKDPELATGFEQIQASFDQVSRRLAELEVPIIENQLPVTAGTSVGYLIVTVGNQQFKVQAYALK